MQCFKPNLAVLSLYLVPNVKRLRDFALEGSSGSGLLALGILSVRLDNLNICRGKSPSRVLPPVRESVRDLLAQIHA